MITRTLLVVLSLVCLKISFVVKFAGAVILRFRLEYKTSVICHTVNTRKRKNCKKRQAAHFSFKPVWNLWKPPTYWCCSSENSFRSIHGFYTQKIGRSFLSVSGAHDYVSINIHSFFVADQYMARYSICSAQEKCVSLAEPYTTHS